MRYLQETTSVAVSVAAGIGTMAAKSGKTAMAIDDLLYLTAKGELFPAQTTAWASPVGASSGGGNAGSALIAETTVSTSTTATINDVRQAVFVNPADRSIFILCVDSGSSVLSKYTAAGALVAQVSMGSAVTSAGSYNIIQLSNGNIAAFGAAGDSTQWFVIYDTDLMTVVAKTALPGPSGVGTTQNWVHAIALSGGGFAVTISAMVGNAYPVYLGIYSNTGAAVLASAGIAGTAALTVTGSRCAQLSNGNIVVAMSSGNGVPPTVAIAIFSAVGATVLAYTAIDNTGGPAGGGGGGGPAVSALNGFFAVGAGVDQTLANRVFVFSNAGVLQGASLTFSVASNGISPRFRLRNDGTYFWLVYTADTSAVTVTRLPTTGAAAAVTTAVPMPNGGMTLDCFIERDMIVLAQVGKICAIAIRADGTVAVLSSATTPTTLPSTGTGSDTYTLKPAGDFTVLAFSPSNGTVAAKFRVWRYLDVALLGVTKTALIAANAGTTVAALTGPLQMQINALPGPAARAFDHSGGNVVGNKGLLMQNSVALKGF